MEFSGRHLCEEPFFYARDSSDFSQSGSDTNDYYFYYVFALRPGGPRHRNAAMPVAISLRSIHAFGMTATA